MQRKNPNKSSKPTAIDVFAGGGGLTVGLKKAGFNVVAAVEKERNAYETYKANHPEVKVFHDDVRNIGSKKFRATSPTGKIDLLAGCPPCQGFSSLTAKYKRRDPRNQLIHEMARLVEELQPRVVMMENVPGLTVRGKKLFNSFVSKLRSLNYVVTYDVLQVADYGVPQRRRRLVLLAGKKRKLSLPKKTHSREGKDGLKKWRTVRDAIYGLPRPIPLARAIKNGGPAKYNWHVIRVMSEQNRMRLKHAKPGASRAKLPRRYRPDCHKNVDKGFSSVYGRLAWNQASVTITGGCTTLSKGRFGHPVANRTISVREAALLQTFPMNYRFKSTHMDRVCDIVGNALPCKFAQVVASQCFAALT
jgi:DNA (cytosine-5)-methyltransferase 1